MDAERVEYQRPRLVLAPAGLQRPMFLAIHAEVDGSLCWAAADFVYTSPFCQIIK